MNELETANARLKELVTMLEEIRAIASLTTDCQEAREHLLLIKRISEYQTVDVKSFLAEKMG